jgi:MoxR-like ATPase
VVLLIDEIDKADIEFPNDLLNELDEMSFYIKETKETIVGPEAAHRGDHLQLGKGAARRLLRRCVFHYIEFPDPELMKKIIVGAFPQLEKKLLQQVLAKFYWLQADRGIPQKAQHQRALGLDLRP